MPTVLVVDDTPSIRFLIRTNLELAGFDVLEAQDGRECLEMLARIDVAPDVITMDMMMPRMDGITAIDQIRNDQRLTRTAIVMISTQSQQSDLNAAMAAGADEYLIKPFDPDDLVSTVERVVHSRG